MMKQSTSTTTKSSCFDGVYKTFWENGDKSINNDPIYKLSKLKKNKMKEQNYSIDLKLFTFKKVSMTKGNYQIIKSFNLIITSYRVINDEQCRILTKQEKQMYGWEFYRNQTYFQIFSQDKHIHEFLSQIFMRLCVQNDFHEKYDCVKKIGGDAYGQVFQAKKKQSDVSYAIKGYNKNYLTLEAKQLKGLSNEIHIMRQLDNTSILKLEEVYETRNSIYLVFQFHSGGHLLERFQQKTKIAPRLSQRIVNQIMKNLVSAILYLHNKGIMHRNLSPDNIIFRNLNDHTDVLLSDFGFADYSIRPKMIYKRCGTAGYFAPEVLSYRVGDLAYNEKCDVFSLGSIFYVLLTGQNPFETKEQEVMIQRNKEGIVNFDHPALRSRPEATIDLLQQMLTVSPIDRISIEDAQKHNYFKVEYLPQESQINNIFVQQGSYSKFTKQSSQSNQFTSNQFMTMQRLPLGSQLSPESSPQSSTNDISLRDKNYLGYDTKQKFDDNEKSQSLRVSFDNENSPKVTNMKKSQFSKSSIHIKNQLLERSLTDELQECRDGHNISQMMTKLNTFNNNDRSGDVNNNDYHSAQQIDDMNFSELLQNVTSVESKSHEIQKSKSKSKSPPQTYKI